MDVVSVVAVGGSILAVPAAILVGTGMWTRARAKRKARLSDSFERLKILVAELLERVNDLDQKLQYAEPDSTVAERLKVAASDMVTVTDCLPAIQQLLSESRLDDCADMLSASTRVIEKVKKLLDQVEPHARTVAHKKLADTKPRSIRLIPEQDRKS